jgi:hypothetical protein
MTSWGRVRGTVAALMRSSATSLKPPWAIAAVLRNFSSAISLVVPPAASETAEPRPTALQERQDPSHL